MKSILYAVCTVLLFGCTTFNSGNPVFTVRPYWAQDTLKEQNYKFRKINRMSPVAHSSSIVVGNAIDGLVAYDIKTKNVKWRTHIDLGVEASGVSVRDTFFIGSNNGKFYSIDLNDGEVNWIFDTKSEVTAEPLLEDGVLYFISAAQSLYAVDATNGKQIWIYSRQDTSGSMTIRGSSRPTLNNGMIYAGFSDGSLVAVNSKTGTEQWEITLNRNTKFKDIDSSPVISDSIIYINSYDDKLYAISQANGEILWTSPYGGNSTPLIWDELIYASSSRGELAALEKKTGKAIWNFKSTNGIFTDVARFGDLIVVGESQGSLLFVDRNNGVILGKFEPGRGVFSKPTVNGNSVFFISGEGNLYGIEAGFKKTSSIKYLQ